MRRRGGDDYVAERAVFVTVGVQQVPMLFTAYQVSDLARETHRQMPQQASGDGAHARLADPAGLLVGGGGQLAVFIVVQVRFPLDGPAFGLPLLDFIDKAPVPCGEILSPQVQYANITALARHAPAAATTFIEKMNRMPCIVQ